MDCLPHLRGGEEISANPILVVLGGIPEDYVHMYCIVLYCIVQYKEALPYPYFLNRLAHTDGPTRWWPISVSLDSKVPNASFGRGVAT